MLSSPCSPEDLACAGVAGAVLSRPCPWNTCVVYYLLGRCGLRDYRSRQILAIIQACYTINLPFIWVNGGCATLGSRTEYAYPKVLG
jgi:hypothetical protein